MLLDLRNPRIGAVAEADPAGHLSLSCNRHGDGIRRRMERQHRGGIFSLQGTDLYHSGPGSDHQQSHRQRRVSRAAIGDDSDGGGGGYYQPVGLASFVSTRRDPISLGNLANLVRRSYFSVSPTYTIH